MWDAGERQMTARQAHSPIRDTMGTRRGRHREEQLAATSARMNGPGRHCDVRSLYLVVERSGQNLWPRLAGAGGMGALAVL